MAEIKGFSFYRSYYECLKDLDKETQNELLQAMLKFVFENKKPKFSGLKKTIWTLLEPNLNTSKNRSNKKSGAPIGNQNACKIRENEEKNKTIEKQSNNNQITINDIKDISLSLSLSLSLSILNLILEYINIRINNNYIVNNTIIKRLIKKLVGYSKDEKEQEEIITNAINGKWKDFYPLNEKKQERSNDYAGVPRM
jgi:hypothetical protein